MYAQTKKNTDGRHDDPVYVQLTLNEDLRLLEPFLDTKPNRKNGTTLARQLLPKKTTGDKTEHRKNRENSLLLCSNEDPLFFQSTLS